MKKFVRFLPRCFGLRRLAAGLLILAALGGCRGIAGPSWTHPGTAAVQEKRALRYDPYPEKEPGPSMEGTRRANTTLLRPRFPAPAGNSAIGDSDDEWIRGLPLPTAQEIIAV